MVSQIPELPDGQAAFCPRCNILLRLTVRDCGNKVLAYGTASLIILMISCVFPFMAISVKGISQQVALLDALSVFYYFNDISLAALLLLTIIVLPTLYLLGLISLFAIAQFSATGRSYPSERPVIKRLFRLICIVEPWLLADIFFVGVLVSMIKLASLTDVHVDIAFWAYFVFILLLLKCTRSADRHWLCSKLFARHSTGNVQPGDTHQSGNHLVCHLCDQINPLNTGSNQATTHCQRCDSRLHRFDPAHSSNITTALLITAIVFFFPANLYPMMYTTSLGSKTGSTIMDGVLLLWTMGSYPVAIIILIASIILPVTKMLILGYLLWSQHLMGDDSANGARDKLKRYRFIEIIGRWSMIDVFVVAILAALVQFGELMEIAPGPAVFYFSLVVIFSVLSTRLFDPRIIWQFSDGQNRYRPLSAEPAAPDDGNQFHG